MLASLLLPVLSRAKDKAITVTDINNLKQQILATHLYCSDSTDLLPWPNWLAGEQKTNRPGWLYTYDNTAEGHARFKVQTGMFWKTLGNPRLYLCPADKTNAPLFGLRSQQVSSYVMNGAVIGYQRMVSPCVKLTAVWSEAVAFWETDELKTSYFNDGSSYPPEGVSARHNRGAINATFGGSVGFIKFDSWYRDVADPTKNRLWCYPGSPDGR
jgi:hypothetical protein